MERGREAKKGRAASPGRTGVTPMGGPEGARPSSTASAVFIRSAVGLSSRLQQLDTPCEAGGGIAIASGGAMSGAGSGPEAAAG